MACVREFDVLVFSYLQFKKCETSTSSCSSVVLNCRTLNDRSEVIDWSRSNFSGLCKTSLSSSVLSSWLIEVNSNSSLPVLVKVVVRYCVIVLDCLHRLLAVDCEDRREDSDHFDGSKTQQARLVEEFVDLSQVVGAVVEVSMILRSLMPRLCKKLNLIWIGHKILATNIKMPTPNLQWWNCAENMYSPIDCIGLSTAFNVIWT